MRNPFNFAAPGALTRCAILVLGLTTAAHAAPASTFQKIYVDRHYSVAGALAVGPDGTLYGAARADLTWSGNVFALTPPKLGQTTWSATNIWTFDSSEPGGGVIMGAGGNIYGVKSGNSPDPGEVYTLAKPAGSNMWRETTFYNFTGDKKSWSGPKYNLVQAKNGVFYGIADGSPTWGASVIFKLTPPAAGETAWTEQLLYTFGSDPSGPLLMDSNGALYGVTETGGPHNYGVVYKLTPPISGSGAWTYTVLYAFNGGTDGAFPVGRLVMDSHGAIYGATNAGGSIYHPPNHSGGVTTGVVFKLTPPLVAKTPWTKSTLYTFKGADGLNPYAGLVMDKSGALYGTTVRGGVVRKCYLGCGVVFKLTPPGAGQTKWTETVLHAFTGGLDSSAPSVDLTMDNSGALYGATYGGGDFNKHYSTVFKIVP